LLNYENIMSEYKPTGIWASEAFDFLLILQKFINRLWGLLLLEIGWGVVLLIPKEFTNPNTIPSLGIPIGISFVPFHLQIYEIELGTIYIIGALTISLVWLGISGFFTLGYLPIVRFVRITVVFLIIIVLTPCMLIIRSIVLILKIGLKTKLGKKIGLITSKFTPKVTPLIYIIRWVKTKLIKLFLHVEIGLMPYFFSSSIEEEIRIGKSPSQLFSSIIGNIKSQLGAINTTQSANFLFLPYLFRFNTPDRSRFMNFFLGMDIVVWGSYTQTDPPELWINFEYDIKQKSDDILFAHLKFQNNNPFILPLENYYRSFIIKQNDIIDTHSVILLCLVNTLEKQKGFFYEALNFLGINVDIQQDEDELIYHLITHVLFKIDEPIEANKLYPTAKTLLIKISSQWLVKRMANENLFKKNSVEFYREVAEKCITLEPGEANHYYRLAAIECIAGNEKKAQEILEPAIAYDTNIKWVFSDNFINIRLVKLAAKDFLEDTTGILLAQRTISIAREILSESAKASFRSAFINSEYYKDLREGKISIGKQHRASMQILFDLLGIEMSTIRFEMH
jgi:tetratricopeptide (TPR) repeat protein